MQSKRYRIAALVLALLLVLSFGLVMFAGCADDQEKDGDTSAGENAAAKLVTDESLKSKLLALYDFEESDKDASATLYGYDPFTGEANGRDGYYSSEGAAQTASIDSLEDSVEGSSSKTAFNVTSGITLNGALEGLYSDDTTKGASVSFWAYNYDMSATVSDDQGAGTLAVDYGNVVSNSLASLTWGNIRGNTTTSGELLRYPSYVSGTTPVTVGRGAYTEESYAARRVLSNATDSLMQSFDSGETDPYTGWNAIAGNIQTAKDDHTYNVVYNIAHSYYQNWRYVTVSIQTDGVYFYTNGRLAYYYSAALIGTDWYTETDITNQDELLFGADQYTRFIAALNGTEYFGYTLDMIGAAFGMFGYESFIYADDVILGYALSESEACDLYENVSGKTYTAEDLECTAALGEDEQAKAEEQNTAVTNYIAEQIASYAVEGDAWGTAAADAGKTGQTGIPGPAGKDTNDDGVIKDVIKTAQQEFIAAYQEEDYLETVGSLDLDSAYVNGGTSSYFVPTAEEDGTFSMTISGINLSVADYNYKCVGVHMFSGTTRYVITRVDWATNQVAEGLANVTSGALTWVDSSTNGVYLNVIMRYCPQDIILAFDGEQITITYNLYYLFRGQTVTLETENYGSFEHTFTDDEARAQTVTYTITAKDGDLSAVLDTALLSIRLGCEDGAYCITNVAGGTIEDSAPTAAE